MYKKCGIDQLGPWEARAALGTDIPSHSHLLTVPLAHVDAVEVSLDEHGFYLRDQANGQAVRAHRHHRVDAYREQRLPRLVLGVHRRRQ